MPMISPTSFGVYGPIGPLMILRHPCGAAEINRWSSRGNSSTSYEPKSKVIALVVILATAIVAFTISQGSDQVQRRIPFNFAATTSQTIVETSDPSASAGSLGVIIVNNAPELGTAMPSGKCKLALRIAIATSPTISANDRRMIDRWVSMLSSSDG
jgi:hypothetical protein